MSVPKKAPTSTKNSLKNRRVALIVDNPARDLAGLVLLGWKLASEGVQVCLVPQNVRKTDLWSLAPEFVLANYLRRNNEDMVRELINAGVKVAVLDTEGAVFSPPHSALKKSARKQSQKYRDMAEYAITLSTDAVLRRRLEFFFSWTPEFAEFVVDDGLFDKKQVHVTGTPRSDFYSKNLRSAARQITQAACKYQSPLVMINGSFPYANPRFKSPEAELKGRSTYDDRTPEAHKEWQQVQRKTMLELASLANRLAKTFPNVTFVYRPHPFEGLAIYGELLDKNLGNLHLEHEGPIDGWMMRASAAVQVASSTAVNAAMLGVPVFDPKWIDRRAAVPTADLLSVASPSEDKLFEDLKRVFENSYTLPQDIVSKKDEAIAKTFYRVDGQSHERLAAKIFESLANASPVQPSPKICQAQLNFKPSKAGLLLAKIRRFLRLPSDFSFRTFRRTQIPFDKTQKVFSSADVQSIINAIDPNGTVVATHANSGGYARHSYPYLRSIVLEKR